MDQEQSGVFSSRGHRRWFDGGLVTPQVTAPSESGRVVSLGRDLVKLVDLQFQLFALDLRQFWADSRTWVVLVVLAATFVLGSIPVFLLGSAQWISLTWQVPVHLALFGLGAIVMLGGGVCVYRGVRGVYRAGHNLKRSHDELIKNLDWMREILNRDEEDDD